MRIGVVAIHGVAPHSRYEIEDEFAEALHARLNQGGVGGGGWELTSEYIPFTAARDPESVRVTVDRVSNGDDAIDVIEAYWSPIDKNHTNLASLGAWALKTVFVPLNNRAHFPGRRGKALFDVGYIVVAFLVAAALIGLTLWLAGRSYNNVASVLVGDDRPTLADVLTNPLKLIAKTSFQDTMLLVAGLAGAVCLAQAISAVIGGAIVRGALARTIRRARRRQPNHTKLDRLAVVVRIACVAALGVVLLLVAAFVPSTHANGTHGSLGAIVLLFLYTVLALQAARSIGNDFLVNRLGDVQIYTIGDENSAYFALREQIRTVAENALIDMIHRKNDDAIPETVTSSAKPATPYYDQIVVAGHSLGATIGMDALLRVHEIHEATTSASGDAGIIDADWNRVRAFVTFGSALEKTKFFFAALRPSFSAEREGWSSKLYGHLFTPHLDVLAGPNDKTLLGTELGIYWLNFYYRTDCIANAIESYRSDVAPRTWTSVLAHKRVVAENNRLPTPWSIFPHSNYLGDENFWLPVADNPTCALDVFCMLLRRPRPGPPAPSQSDA